MGRHEIATYRKGVVVPQSRVSGAQRAETPGAVLADAAPTGAQLIIN